MARARESGFAARASCARPFTRLRSIETVQRYAEDRAQQEYAPEAAFYAPRTQYPASWRSQPLQREHDYNEEEEGSVDANPDPDQGTLNKSIPSGFNLRSYRDADPDHTKQACTAQSASAHHYTNEAASLQHLARDRIQHESKQHSRAHKKRLEQQRLEQWA
ncbi:hypothetical protein BV25DRAFT_1840603 [Artomyces pyxidatus]|uniref:Uncharacterized protein n=1 Tax=Artomyces pyxidatus TaxID=48021 RepID=A0ACB8SRC9_9AGAM|nr:hypothetical protein BV25DRAFT_1840603 [Artomyces pyxidatus]